MIVVLPSETRAVNGVAEAVAIGRHHATLLVSIGGVHIRNALVVIGPCRCMSHVSVLAGLHSALNVQIGSLCCANGLAILVILFVSAFTTCECVAYN